MQGRKLQILKQVFGPYHRSGEEYLFHCPQCNHHKNKLSINLEKDVYKCWVCDFRGRKIHRLIRRYGTLLQKSEWESFSPVEIPANIKEFIEDFYKKEVIKQHVELPEEFETLTNFENKREQNIARNYLYSRGLSNKDILMWKIGFCPTGPYGGRIIIPSFDNFGNVNYFVGRAYKNLFNKYKNPKVDKKHIIFNELYIDWNKDLVLVEGPFDAIKSVNAVPILGSTLDIDYKLFQEIIKHDTPIFVALDKDVLKKVFSLIQKLISYDIEVYKIDTTKIKTDIGDITKEDFVRLKQEALLMDEKELLKEKLRIRM